MFPSPPAVTKKPHKIHKTQTKKTQKTQKNKNLWEQFKVKELIQK